MTYAIYEGNLERLEKKLQRIANKCKAFGCEFHYEKKGEEIRPVHTKKDGWVDTKFILVEAEGIAQMNDWEFIATLEHTEEGNIIRKYAEEVEVPERYYNSEAFCEHCNSKRSRKNTYIVRNIETGEFKQVGKSCLKDFTNGLSAEAVAQYISCFEELIQGEAPEEGRSIKRYVETKEICRYFVETYKKFGYVRAEDFEISTATRAESYFLIDKGNASWLSLNLAKKLKEEMQEVGFDANRKEVVDIVEDAFNWVKTNESNTNYMHNLKVAVSQKWTDGSTYNLLASLFPVYDKNLEREAEKRQREELRKRELEAGKNSDYVGEVGQRITIDVDSARVISSWENQFGTTWLYKFVDKQGNVYVWYASRTIGDGSDVEKLVGTIKDHKEFNEVKQTVLTRCKIG